MNNFFEKLTGIRTKAAPDPIELTARKSSPLLRRQEAPAELSRSMHLRIEEGDASTAPQEMEPPEEGELTVDIYDKGDAIVIQSTVAGVKPEDLDVSITSDSVTIRGRRERQEEVHEDDYYYKELFWGTFSRSVILPEEIEEDMAEAVLKHGLLSIRLPKKKRGMVQKLKVKVT